MRAMCRSIGVGFLVVVSAVLLGITSMVSPFGALAATTAVILGGTGTPSPIDEPGYIPNISDYYIYPHSALCPDAGACTQQSFFTPETAWPLYGGLSAPTWKQSILQGYGLLDSAVRTDPTIPEDQKFLLFGYSQSGAILALEKRALADDPDIDESDYEIVVIGNVSRPNGGLNGRLPITIPIVEFPFGPVMPTDTQIQTTDVAMKWDIIADAPLYVTNPLAMANALLGGPGFGIIHGTYPNPEPGPDGPGPGGYTRAEWEAMMADPTNPAYKDIITVDERDLGNGNDTTYITVTPKILPLVQPLHSIPVVGKPVADLIEPSLRVIIEETGYDRTIPYGQPTTFRLIPIFNPVKLAKDLAPAVKEGVDNFVDDLGQVAPATPTPVTTPLLAKTESKASVDTSTQTELETAKTAKAVKAKDKDAKKSTKPSSAFRPLRQLRDGVKKFGKNLADAGAALQSAVTPKKETAATQTESKDQTPGGETKAAA